MFQKNKEIKIIILENKTDLSKANLNSGLRIIYYSSSITFGVNFFYNNSFYNF